jgi:hypothetical protein
LWLVTTFRDSLSVPSARIKKSKKTLEYVTERFSQNFSNKLPAYGTYHPRRAKDAVSSKELHDSGCLLEKKEHRPFAMQLFSEG